MTGIRTTTCVLAALFGSAAIAQVTQRMSVSSSGIEGNGGSYAPSTSVDGRYVAFNSLASNLVTGDTNGFYDVFVHDRVLGTTERVSVSTAGAQGDGDSSFSFTPSISSDGRYVAFSSVATTLVTGDTNGFADVFVRDRQNGTTVRVSLSTGGAQGNGDSMAPSISGDGRYVAFESLASNLVTGDTNGTWDVFVHDLQTGTTERVSLGSNGAQAAGGSYWPAISSDGRYVAFQSYAANLVSGDTNGFADVFVRDRTNGTTERANVSTGGAQANNTTFAPSISADGRYVGIFSLASNLVANDTNGSYDVFLRDRTNGTTERVSLSDSGAEGNADSSLSSISADGRYVVFESNASNLVAGDTNTTLDVFLRDRVAATTQRVSVDSTGAEAMGSSTKPWISADGRFVAFESFAPNLVAGDTNSSWDVFVHDQASTGITSLCDPGVAGVLACPCSNPPSTSGRGCDNSAGTGGAALSGSGIAYLSMDSLVFTTSGERATATSILLQGTALASSGVVYGQGIRCVGGTLKRLFTKSAVAGSIVAPDFGAGDPTVSARSAAKGDVIQPGESRWYLVYYRDPTVLGGCPSSSTFNSSQTGRIDWSP
jgi:hypothetical protein